MLQTLFYRSRVNLFLFVVVIFYCFFLLFSQNQVKKVCRWLGIALVYLASFFLFFTGMKGKFVNCFWKFANNKLEKYWGRGCDNAAWKYDGSTRFQNPLRLINYWLNFEKVVKPRAWFFSYYSIFSYYRVSSTSWRLWCDISRICSFSFTPINKEEKEEKRCFTTDTFFNCLKLFKFP